MKKKKIVENDKAKIQKTIEELDQMKNEAVTKAYIQVSYFITTKRYCIYSFNFWCLLVINNN